MKKLFLTLTFTRLFVSPKANAGFYSSNWFEPTVLCAVGGAVGISGDGDATQAGLYCLGGAILGYTMNQYWRKKVDIVHEDRIQRLKDEVRVRVVRQAEKANLGIIDDYYAIEAEQIEEAQEQPDGSVFSPTKKILLKAP